MSGNELYKKAEKALENGYPEMALEICAKLPDDVDAKALAVEILAELGRWPEAEKAAAIVLEEDPQWATGYLVLGFAAIERVDLKAAQLLLERAWKEDQNLVDAPLTLAAMADFAGDFAGGDKWVEKARKADSTVPPPLHLNAVSFDELLLQVVDQFGEKSSDTLDESHFRVLPMPSPSDVAQGTGIGDAWRIEDLDPEGDPPTFSLTLYQRNMERGASSPTDVASLLDEALTEAMSQLSELAEKADGEEPDDDDVEDDEGSGYGEDEDVEDDDEPVAKKQVAKKPVAKKAAPKVPAKHGGQGKPRGKPKKRK